MAGYADLILEQASRVAEFGGDVGFISLDVRDYGSRINIRETNWTIWDGEDRVTLENSSLSALVTYIDNLLARRELLRRKF